MKNILLGTAACLLFLGATPLFADTEATREVVTTHLRGVGQLDVDAAVAPYSDDATLIISETVCHGPDEIRGFYEEFFAEFSQPGISMETEGMVIDGNIAMSTWNAESPDNIYEFGTDTYIVENGMIVSHTMAARITPK